VNLYQLFFEPNNLLDVSFFLGLPKVAFTGGNRGFGWAVASPLGATAGASTPSAS